MSDQTTPGPWKAGEAAWFRGRPKDDTESGKRPITSVEPGHAVIANVYGRSNAHLIAAAPDLYEALKQLLEVAQPFVGYSEAGQLLTVSRDNAKAAIKKAEGR